ncbi:MAG: hypothetical protein HQL99_04965 [Magnetococcales bacterium]|nr:hypothetical protein [Magnetococcales bacterium]
MSIPSFGLFALAAVVWWLCGGAAHAAAGTASEPLRSCLLDHVKPARSALAAQHLQQACTRRFSVAPDSQTLEIRPEKEDELYAYDHCLLRHLSGVQNDASAQAMERFCHDQFHPGESAVQGPARVEGVLNWLQAIDRAPSSRESPSASAPVIDGESFVPLAPARAGR